MAFKLAGFLVVCLVIGSNALPVQEDWSIFFDHTDSSARIVGGQAAGVTPHMVGLVSGVLIRNLMCGASIISNRHILTAAHCLVSVISSNGAVSSSLRGVIGSNSWRSGGTQISFSRGINHPNYEPLPILNNDIGLLVASANIVLSNTISIVPLSWEWVGAGVDTRVTGWGATRTGGSLSTNLLQHNAQTIDGNFCKEEVARKAIELGFRGVPDVDPNTEICTFLALGQGTCNGDSGSALTRSDNGMQVGIVSWGLPCARGAPDMFVRVSAHRDWILSNMI